jgi:hypothetical protein
MSAIADFCRAVLADNRPRAGEPWDTIANAINAGRKRAYRAGFNAGAASCDRNPQGQDREAGLGAEHESAVGAAETPQQGCP